jgi:hypothetical protein
MTAIAHSVCRLSQLTIPTDHALQLEDIVTAKVQASGGNSAVLDIYKWINYVALEIIGQAGEPEASPSPP